MLAALTNKPHIVAWPGSDSSYFFPWFRDWCMVRGAGGCPSCGLWAPDCWMLYRLQPKAPKGIQGWPPFQPTREEEQQEEVMGIVSGTVPGVAHVSAHHPLARADVNTRPHMTARETGKYSPVMNEKENIDFGEQRAVFGKQSLSKLQAWTL